MKIVISLGGSVLVPDKPDLEYMKDFAEFLNSQENEIHVVVGGGKRARNYISDAKRGNASETECDYYGIKATRENAALLAKAVGSKASQDIPKSFIDAREMMNSGKIVIMGGTHPGHSTDGVAAMLADYIKADMLIKISDVDGIYDKDPDKFKDAKLLKKIDIKELIEMACKESQGAGKYALIDLLAAKTIERSGLKTVFVSRDLNNLRKVVNGRDFVGTTIEGDHS